MTNFKNMVAAITLLVVMAFTATVANAGLIISDRQTIPTVPAPCEVKDNGPDSGIIVFGLIEGIIVFGRTGIIVFGKSETPACDAK